MAERLLGLQRELGGPQGVSMGPSQEYLRVVLTCSHTETFFSSFKSQTSRVVQVGNVLKLAQVRILHVSVASVLLRHVDIAGEDDRHEECG